MSNKEVCPFCGDSLSIVNVDGDFQSKCKCGYSGPKFKTCVEVANANILLLNKFMRYDFIKDFFKGLGVDENDILNEISINVYQSLLLNRFLFIIKENDGDFAKSGNIMLKELKSCDDISKYGNIVDSFLPTVKYYVDIIRKYGFCLGAFSRDFGPREYEMYKDIEKIVKNVYTDAKKIDYRLPDGTIPDAIFDIKGQIVPVEVKRKKFTFAGVRQLTNYIKQCKSSFGIAIARSFADNIPENIVCMEYHDYDKDR